MNKPDNRISQFIKEHHILTLSTVTENKPYCATCFYAYNEQENYFIILSGEDTNHIRHIKENNSIAVAIALETEMVGKIRGLQMTGTIIKPEGRQMTNAKKEYRKRFPLIVVKKTDVWLLLPDFIKMTDNRLGFGKKFFWTLT